VDLSSVVLAGEPVGRLMDEAESEKEDPEFDNVKYGFVREVVIKPNIWPKKFPLGEEDGGFKEEEKNGDDDAPTAVDESSDTAVEPGEIAVWVPRGEGDVSNVES
jgi:hypothetical protein